MYFSSLLTLLLCSIASYGKPSRDSIGGTYRIIEGDIMVRENLKTEKLIGLNFEHNPGAKWPQNTVPYVISDVFDSNEQRLIKEGFKNIEENSCIRFRKRTRFDRDYVTVVSEEGLSGCFAELGHRGEKQKLSLQKPGCLTKDTVIHETLHALGVIHEQERPDRDEHITIFWDRIPEEWRQWYSITQEDAELFSDYDYESIMHYDAYDPSRNTNEIVMESNPAGTPIEPSKVMSPLDILGLNKMYNCPRSYWPKILASLKKAKKTF